jgi:hypothetical protein
MLQIEGRFPMLMESGFFFLFGVYNGTIIEESPGF